MNRALVVGIIFISTITNAQDKCVSIDSRLLECELPNHPLHTSYVPGEILIEYQVLADGSVENINIVETNVSKEWDKMVYKALRNWKFKPSDKSVVTKTWSFKIAYE